MLLDKLFGKMLLGLIIYGVILFSLMAYSFLYLQERSFQSTAQNNSEYQIIKKEKNLSAYYRHMKNLILSMRYSPLFKGYINNLESIEDKKHLEDLFILLGNSDKDIMQIRLIDKKGQEKIRVDRQKINDIKVTLVKNKDLQNKKNRYYFKNTMAKADGDVWFSQLDLNMEHGAIEIPHKPPQSINN